MSVPVIYSGDAGEHPEDFILTYYMKDTVSGSNILMEINKGKLKVDYINGTRKISKRKFYEIDDEDTDKLYDYMVTEKFLERESPEKTIVQNMAAQYIKGGYNGKENVLIFSAAGDPPMYLLKLKYKFWEIVDQYDKFWKRDMDIKN
jgi:hypothetical protein